MASPPTVSPHNNSLWNSAIQQEYKASHISNLKFSICHTLESVKSTDEINLNNMPYLTQSVQNIIISTCDEYKNSIFTFFIS